MKETILRQGAECILYDGDGPFDLFWFKRDELARRGMAVGAAPAGRAPALFFRADGREYVLKEYHRGGLWGRVVKRAYLYTGAVRVRAFAEWRALARLHQHGLPVPRPVAAVFRRCGLLYTASLITESCRPAMPLSQYLAHQPLPVSAWSDLGRLLHRFHSSGVCHRDLNAHNILCGDGRFWLIDFDRARFFVPQLIISVRHDNIRRLRHSLAKLSARRDQPTAAVFHYDSACFDALIAGYKASMRST